MARDHSVTLASNGRYWTARYYDGLGRRRGKTLGLKSAVSRRQALVLCERLAVELSINPGSADRAKAPAVGVWFDSFLALRPELSTKGTRAYRIACGKFKLFAGEHTRIDRITPAAAAEWVAQLSRRDASAAGAGSTARALSPASVANYCRHVRGVFGEAVRQGILTANPFARIRTQPRRIERRWDYVPRETFTRILAACPNDGWRCFIALQRIGGLRKGEALAATWAMVDWSRRVLTLAGSITKTGQERMVPLDPELLAVLRASHVSATSDQMVAPGQVDRRSESNQHRRFRTILKGAGVPPWEDLFQTLRRNAVQDLRETLKDPWAVTAIAGHSEEVERKYYLGRVRQTDLDRITGGADPKLRVVTERWPALTDEAKDAIVAIAAGGGPTAQPGG